MTHIEFTYRDYPERKSRRLVTLTSGKVTVELGEVPSLPTQDKTYSNRNSVSMKDLPLQRPYRWHFIGDVPDDLKRYVRGRYWHCIPTLLFAQFMRERDLAERAEVYERLGRGAAGG